MGVGINVNNWSMPENLSAIATSLEAGIGRSFDREVVLDSVLSSLESCYVMFCEKDINALIKDFSKASSYVVGRRVTVDAPGGTIHGTTAGLDASGGLLLRKQDGSVEPILVGSVRSWLGN